MPDAASLALTQMQPSSKSGRASRPVDDAAGSGAPGDLTAGLSALPFAAMLQSIRSTAAAGDGAQDVGASQTPGQDMEQVLVGADGGLLLPANQALPDMLTAGDGSGTGAAGVMPVGLAVQAAAAPLAPGQTEAKQINAGSALPAAPSPGLTPAGSEQAAQIAGQPDGQTTGEPAMALPGSDIGTGTQPDAGAGKTAATVTGDPLTAEARALVTMLNGRVLRAWTAEGAQSAPAATQPNPATQNSGSASNTAFAAQSPDGAAFSTDAGQSQMTQTSATGATGSHGTAPTGPLHADAAGSAKERHKASADTALLPGSSPSSAASSGMTGDMAAAGEAAMAKTADSAPQMSSAQPGHRADVPRMPAAHLPLLAAAMARRLDNGSREFTLRLDPAELGRINVKLEMTTDRKVRAVIAADKPEGLAELQRSSRDLEQALADAGLDLAEGGLSFSLDGGGSDTDRGNRDHPSDLPGFTPRQTGVAETAQTAADPGAPRQTGTHDIWRRARVSISA